MDPALRSESILGFALIADLHSADLGCAKCVRPCEAFPSAFLAAGSRNEKIFAVDTLIFFSPLYFSRFPRPDGAETPLTWTDTLRANQIR